jgi:phage-related holin
MYRLINIFHDTCNFLLQLFAFIILYLTPISNYVHLVLLLILFDLITGSWASIKEGQKFSARKLRNTVEKFIFYALAIIVGYILQRIINDGSELARIVALYIGSIEAKSIYENISRIRQVNMVTALWNAMKEKIDEYINSLKSKNKHCDDKN